MYIYAIVTLYAGNVGVGEGKGHPSAIPACQKSYQNKIFKRQEEGKYLTR